MNSHAQSMVTTASFDQVTIVRSIFHGDFIRLEGELVYVGNSSMIIQVSITYFKTQVYKVDRSLGIDMMFKRMDFSRRIVHW